jgi:hypothetical protein
MTFTIERLTPEESAARVKANAILAEIRADDHKRQKAQEAYRRAKERDGASRIYLIRSAGVYKIGVTTSIESRIKTIQSMCPRPVKLLATAWGTAKQERMMHHIFRHRRSHGEWFRLTAEDVANALDFMSRVEANRPHSRPLPIDALADRK